MNLRCWCSTRMKNKFIYLESTQKHTVVQCNGYLHKDYSNECLSSPPPLIHYISNKICVFVEWHVMLEVRLDMSSTWFWHCVVEFEILLSVVIILLHREHLDIGIMLLIIHFAFIKVNYWATLFWKRTLDIVLMLELFIYGMNVIPKSMVNAF